MSNKTNLLHAIISKDVNVVARSPSKPERMEGRRKGDKMGATEEQLS